MDSKKLAREIQDIVALEMGRYLSIATTNELREKAYPRQLFEDRVLKLVQEAINKHITDMSN